MGGGYFDGEVGERSRADTGRQHFQHTAEMLTRPAEERSCHASLNPKNKERECCDHPDHPTSTPVAILMDLTRSRGGDSAVIFGKLPMMVGQIMLNTYVPDPELCFVGVGDANSDRAPLQVGQFESDNRLDNDLGNMWIEKGGGGTGQESYELAAYYMARHTKLDCLKRGAKGICFIFADEGFYPEVDKAHVERVIGDKLKANIPAAQVFTELQAKYDTYVVFPRTSWEDRKADIDEEMAQRVRNAGGMIEGVDVRFTLGWYNRNDLDLHVQGPDGYHIFYQAKKSPSGGFLDVDMNVGGETTKPVENVRWKKGEAPKGTYQVWVEKYNNHDSSSEPTTFKVEIEVNGEIQHFEGSIPSNEIREGSRIKVGSFTFDPKKRVAPLDEKQKYANYDEHAIRAQWATVIPAENILMITDAKASVDIMLGVLAIKGGTRTLDTYIADMKARGQSDTRVEEVRASLADLGQLSSIPKVELPTARRGSATKDRRGASVRLG